MFSFQLSKSLEKKKIKWRSETNVLLTAGKGGGGGGFKIYNTLIVILITKLTIINIFHILIKFARYKLIF